MTASQHCNPVHSVDSMCACHLVLHVHVYISAIRHDLSSTPYGLAVAHAVACTVMQPQ